MSEYENNRDSQERRQRLTPIDRERDLAPWRRAEQMEKCFLYWLPVNGFPIPQGQRQWMMLFLDRVVALLAKQFDLRVEVFLQFETLTRYFELRQKFGKNCVKFHPVLGLSRRPGAGVVIPKPPEDADITAIIEGRKEFRFKDYVADYIYWFLVKSERAQRELFFGYDGMTLLFLPPDPNAQPPEFPFPDKAFEHPLLRGIDARGGHAMTYSLLDGFLPNSKKLFGVGLEEEPEYEGWPYIIPLLETRNFFAQPDEEVSAWLDLFPVYITEAPGDKGVIMASKIDFEEPLIELLKEMRQEDIVYPGME